MSEPPGRCEVVTAGGGAVGLAAADTGTRSR